MSVKVIAYDVGTTGLKTCLFSISAEESVRYLAGEVEHYELHVLENGGVEQEASDWWEAMSRSTKRLLAKTGVPPEEIRGITFCSQFQTVVLVDQAGRPLRRAMSCSRSLMSFAAPGEGFRCPHCGEDLDDEYIMAALSEAFEANPEDPDLLLRAPCCGIILPFNALETTWIGFARFCLQFSGCSCTPEDLAELNALIGTPFKIVHVHD